MPVTLTLGLNHKCCDCGIALKANEIAGEIIGRLVDYGDHKTMEFDGVTARLMLCSGCLGRIKEYWAKDQGDAILKRKLLEADGAKEPPKLDFSHAEEEFKDNLDFRAPDDVGNGM